MNSVGFGVETGRSTFSSRGEVEEGVLKTWFYSAVRDEDLSFVVLEGRARSGSVCPLEGQGGYARSRGTHSPVSVWTEYRLLLQDKSRRVYIVGVSFSRHDGSWDFAQRWTKREM